MSRITQTFRDMLVPLPDHVDPAAEHDYVRCAAGWCGYLDRSEYVGIRLKFKKQGCACCGGTKFVDPVRITLPEINRIRSGWYEEFKDYAHVSTTI